MLKILLIIFFAVCMVACTSVATKENVFKVEKVGTVGSDGASKNEFCADFFLTKNQAQQFFNKAKQVSGKDIHDKYSFLPCFVRGDGYSNNKKCEWEVRAGGTSIIQCADELTHMACEECL